MIYLSHSTGRFIPPLLLQGLQIKTSDLIQFFGLLFDRTSNWTYHIKHLKAKYFRSTNISKYQSHQSRGCNRKHLIRLYKSLIRSQLDYEAPIYNLTNKSVLALLNTSLRLALGAFRTSTGIELCAETADPPPCLP